MGNLIALLQRGGANFVIDFENCSPKPREVETFTALQEKLAAAPVVIQSIMEYVGCQDMARKAMKNATAENELEAFEALLPVVDSINGFFQFARTLEDCICQAVLHLASMTSDADSKEADIDEAVCKQLAEMLNFTLQFDALRMMRPHLSNDFSYYRRLLPKFARHPALKIKDDEASGMALFTAEHIPMLGAAVKGAVKALEQNDSAGLILAAMSNGCYTMLKNKKFDSAETQLFCARAMTGALVLYDHVDPQGAFQKKSPIKTMQIVTMLKKDFPNEVSLVNAVRYSTVHFNDETTPVGIAAQFE